MCGHRWFPSKGGKHREGFQYSPPTQPFEEVHILRRERKEKLNMISGENSMKMHSRTRELAKMLEKKYFFTKGGQGVPQGFLLSPLKGGIKLP